MAQTDPKPVEQPKTWGDVRPIIAAAAAIEPKPDRRAVLVETWLWGLSLTGGVPAAYRRKELVELMQASIEAGGLGLARRTAYERTEGGVFLAAGDGRLLIPAPADCVRSAAHETPHVHTHEERAQIYIPHRHEHVHPRNPRSPIGAGPAPIAEALGEYAEAAVDRLADAASAETAVERRAKEITARLAAIGETGTYPIVIERMAQAAVDAGEWGMRVLREALRETEKAHRNGEITGKRNDDGTYGPPSPGAVLWGLLKKKGLHIPRGPPR